MTEIDIQTCSYSDNIIYSFFLLMTTPFISSDAFPSNKAPQLAKQKVLDHVYRDFENNIQKKWFLQRTKSLKYVSFALLFIIGFWTRYGIQNYNISPNIQKEYAQELTTLLNESEQDLTQLFAMVEEETLIQF